MIQYVHVQLCVTDITVIVCYFMIIDMGGTYLFFVFSEPRNKFVQLLILEMGLHPRTGVSPCFPRSNNKYVKSCHSRRLPLGK